MFVSQQPVTSSPKLLRRYFATGLLIWTPLAITFMVLAWILGSLDRVIEWLPADIQPKKFLGANIPGLGVLMTLGIVLLTGMIATNVIGQKLVQMWEQLLSRIPVVKTIYSSVKQVSDTLFSSSGEAFRQAVLVQYPRQGIWTIAFLTGKPGGEIAQHLTQDCISVYVPTTPNPTSGFFLIMPTKDVVMLEMSVDEALKYVISMGLVAPEISTYKLNTKPAFVLPEVEEPR